MPDCVRPSSPTSYEKIDPADLSTKKAEEPTNEKWIPCNLRPPSTTWREYFMRYNTVFVPPESPPPAKYDKPPVPNAILSPEGKHYIMPCNNDNVVG